MRELDISGEFTHRLVLLEELKGLPFGAVWDYFCLQQGVPVGLSFMDEIRDYEARELSGRT
jgi:L-rhamnose isomerase